MQPFSFYVSSLATRIVASLFCAVLIAGFVPAPAHAAMWRVDANFASYHARAWARRSLNQVNPGLGMTWQVNRTWGVSGGIYRNSYRRPSAYALVTWTPLQVGWQDGWHVDGGIAAGLLSGYKHAEVPCEPIGGGALVRFVAPDDVALNLVAVPNTTSGSGFIGFRLSIPISARR